MSKNTKVIAIVGTTGGCGVSTLAANLAFELSLKNKKVLIWETGSQSDCSKIFLNDNQEEVVASRMQENDSKKTMTVKEIYNETCTIEQAILHTNYENIDIILGNESFNFEPNKFYFDLIFSVNNFIEESAYDFVIADIYTVKELKKIQLLSITDLLILLQDSENNYLSHMKDLISEIRQIVPKDKNIKVQWALKKGGLYDEKVVTSLRQEKASLEIEELEENQIIEIDKSRDVSLAAEKQLAVSVVVQTSEYSKTIEKLAEKLIEERN